MTKHFHYIYDTSGNTVAGAYANVLSYISRSDSNGVLDSRSADGSVFLRDSLDVERYAGIGWKIELIPDNKGYYIVRDSNSKALNYLASDNSLQMQVKDISSHFGEAFEFDLVSGDDYSIRSALSYTSAYIDSNSDTSVVHIDTLPNYNNGEKWNIIPILDQFSLSSEIFSVSIQEDENTYSALTGVKTLVGTKTIKNCASNSQVTETVLFSKTVSTLQSVEFSSETTLGGGLSTIVSAEVGFFGTSVEVSGTASVEWSETSSESTTSEFSSEKTIEVSQEVSVDPGSCVKVLGYFTLLEDVSLPFTAHIMFSAKNEDGVQVDNTSLLKDLLAAQGASNYDSLREGNDSLILLMSGTLTGSAGIDSYVETESCSCTVV